MANAELTSLLERVRVLAEGEPALVPILTVVRVRCYCDHCCGQPERGSQLCGGTGYHVRTDWQRLREQGVIGALKGALEEALPFGWRFSFYGRDNDWSVVIKDGGRLVGGSGWVKDKELGALGALIAALEAKHVD